MARGNQPDGIEQVPPPGPRLAGWRSAGRDLPAIAASASAEARPLSSTATRSEAERQGRETASLPARLREPGSCPWLDCFCGWRSAGGLSVSRRARVS
jgi:hypothetical protein